MVVLYNTVVEGRRTEKEVEGERESITEKMENKDMLRHETEVSLLFPDVILSNQHHL